MPDVAVVHDVAPYVSAYPFTAGVGFGAKYTDPLTTPTGIGRAVAFNGDTDVAVAHDTSPYISAYPWTLGGGFGVKYSNPGTAVAGNATGVDFSPGKNVVAVSHTTTPYVTVYRFTSGSGFGTKYSNPASAVAGNGKCVRFNKLVDGIAIGHETTPYGTAYPWTYASGFGSKYLSPGTLPPGTVTGMSFNWGSSTTKNSGFTVYGGYKVGMWSDILLSSNTTPYICGYGWAYSSSTAWQSGGRFTAPGTLPTGAAAGVAVCYGLAVAVAHTTSPYITAYPFRPWSGYGTKYTNPLSLPGGNGTGVCFNGKTDLIVSHNTGSPYMAGYPFTPASGFGVKYADPGTPPTGTAYGVAVTRSTVTTNDSTGTGNWEDPGTWTLGHSPVLGENCRILAGHTVTLNASASVGADFEDAILIQATGKLYIPPSIAANVTLTVRGDFVVFGTFQIGDSKIVPIPYGRTVTIQLNSSEVAASGRWGLYTGDGATIAIYGDDSRAYAWATLTANMVPTATHCHVDKAIGWKSGDTVIFMPSGIKSQATNFDAKLLSGDASGQEFNITSGVSYNHYGVAPVATEVMNCNRNVIIQGVDTTYVGIIYISGNPVYATLYWCSMLYFGHLTGYPWVEQNLWCQNMGVAGYHDYEGLFYGYCGSSGSDNGGIMVQSTAGYPSYNFSLKNSCRYYGYREGLRLYAYGATQNFVIDYVLQAYSLGSGVAGIGAAGQTALISYGYVKDLVCVSSTYIGLTFSGGRQCSMLFTQPLSGIRVHHCANGQYYGVNLNGFRPEGTLEFEDCLFYANGQTYSLYIYQVPEVTFRRCIIEGGASALVGIEYTAGPSQRNIHTRQKAKNVIAFYDCEFSGGPAGDRPSYAISFGGSYSSIGAEFHNCKFNVTDWYRYPIAQTFRFYTGNADLNEILVDYCEAPLNWAASLSGTSYGYPILARFVSYGKSRGDDRTYLTHGPTQIASWTRDTSVYRTASPSERVTPTLTTAHMSALYGLVGGRKYVAVNSGDTVTIHAWILKSAAFNGTLQPRLMLTLDNSLFTPTTAGEDEVLDTASGGVGVWEELTATTPAALQDGVFEFYIDQINGTAGYINIDDWSVD